MPALFSGSLKSIKIAFFVEKKKMKKVLLMSVLFCLAACTWETYETQEGGMALRQKYPKGTGIYYTNGAASQNTHYHHSRPEPHAILPEKTH